MGLAEEKAAARDAAKIRRDEAHARWGAAAPAMLLQNFAKAFPLLDGAVSGYWPGRSEIDIRPLLAHLAQAGHALGLPVITGRGKPLIFRRWRPGDALEPRGFGLSEPPPTAPELVPSVLLVPLLAVDDEGYRIGYGAGYYDRTLAALRRAGAVVAIGVGYEAQRVVLLPRDAHDERLDWLATEAGVARFGDGRQTIGKESGAR